MRFSPSTGAFYDPAIHAADVIPADSVAISRARFHECVAARALGKSIVADADGKPCIRVVRPSHDERRRQIVRRIKAEARRRIVAIATLERQANDNAAIAQAAIEEAVLGQISTDFVPALERRKAIDAIRAASDRIEARLSDLTAAALASFDPSDDALWS